MSVLVVGISHNSAPMALLEQVALDGSGLVGDADDEDAHDTTSDPGAIDLRCSW